MEDPIVIVGLSFQFPQDATSEDSLWEIIRHGGSTMTEVPASRYNIQGHYSHTQGRQNGVAARGGHYIKGDISAFDAPFFRMSSAEAKAMDPQLRLLLETTYHAFESAGLSLSAVAGSNTSVYVSCIVQEYDTLYAYDEEIDAKYAATGSSHSMLSNRLSWFYDLKGSSVSLDTACSSSLVGLHLGCQSLLHGESDMCLVGGVQLQLEPRRMAAAVSRLGFLSPDSQCYSFDDRANGYSRGEGIAMIVLKRLSKALEDGDTIRGVIRGTFTNQDGRTPSVTQPSATAQAALIERTYQIANLGFEDTSYFEAHGTGTAIGDPTEAEGISRAFTRHRNPDKPLYVGSVKANIGHLEPLAGLAGLIKTIMVLERGVIPPNALLKNLNPRILADKWLLNFPTTAVQWPAPGIRRASVNSFGYGGTNAHLIVDDAFHYMRSRGLSGKHNVQVSLPLDALEGPLHQPYMNGIGVSESDPEKMVFLLSAADENGINRQASALATHLAQCSKKHSYGYLQDLAFNLSERRGSLPWKSCVLASALPDLEKGLEELAQKPVRSSERPCVQFVFTGQGAQWASMGMELLRYPAFRKTVDHADTFFRSIGSTWSALDELSKPEQHSRVQEACIAQPLCTVLQMALVDLLLSWNIHPEAVVGHSSGEIAAAYSIGALTKDSALRVAHFRGECVARFQQTSNQEKGGMLAVGLSAEQLEPHIKACLPADKAYALEYGCFNSPISTTVTGLDEYIDALASRLQALRIFSRKLNVPVAYHSRQMLAVADSYRASLKGYLTSEAEITSKPRPVLFSSVTGLKASRDELSTAEYWVRNLVSPVKFSQALQCMHSSLCNSQENRAKPLTYLVEVGPHCSLERAIRDTLSKGSDFVYDFTMHRSSSSVQTVKELAGRLAVHGHAVNVQAVNYHHGYKRQPKVLLDLPKYVFNHSQSYWIESRLSKNVRTREDPRHELLGTRSADWNPLRPTWRIVLRETDLPWVSDHKVDGIILYPAAGMLVMAVEGIRSLPTSTRQVAGYKIRDINIGSALVLPSGEEGVEVQLHMSPCSSTSETHKGIAAWMFWIHSVANGEWKLHCSGQISVEEDVFDDIVTESADSGMVLEGLSSFRTVHERCSNRLDSSDLYQAILEKSVDLGKTFRTLNDIHYNEADREATASLFSGAWRQEVKDSELSDHLIHPTTLDGMFHIPFASVFAQIATVSPVVPRQITEVFLSNDLLTDEANDALHLYGSTFELGAFGMKADVTAVNPLTAEPLISLRGIHLQSFHATDKRVTGSSSSTATSLFHRFEWKPDVSLLSPTDIEDYCREHTKKNDMPSGGFDGETELVCRYFLSDMLEQLGASGSPEASCSSKPSIQKYVRWAKSFLEDEKETTLILQQAVPRFEEQSIREQFLETYASKSLQKQQTVDYGRKLVAIVKEEVDALGLLFNDGLAESLYSSPTFSLTAHRLAGYMDLLAHKNSDLKILEVGAGTGSTTTPVLDVLALPSAQAPRFRHYDFTDISPSFFADAQVRYAAHSDRMRFKVLDIERDPVEQGFEPASYDVVIAAAVLHATSSIEQSLKNAKKLLKPGGQLVFWEPTNRRLASTPFFVGVLPGWWLSTEKNRSSGPLLTRPEWNEALLRAGFDGLHVSLPDDVEENHGLSLLVSHALELPNGHQANTVPSTIIVVETSAHEDLARRIQSYLASRTETPCEIVHFKSLTSMDDTYDQCICLLELGKPVLAHLNETRFAALRRMMAIATRFVWVTDQCGVDAYNPEAAMASGWGKVLARERPELSFTHLNLQNADDPEGIILRVVNQSMALPQEEHETDLLEEDGRVLIPRAVEAPDVKRLYDSEISGLQPEPATIISQDDETAPKLELRFSPGRLDSLHFGPDTAATRPLEDDEIRISTRATGINFRDVMVALNQIADDHIGAEFAGLVLEVGAACKTTFAPGDRVCGLLDGSFRTIVRAKAANLVKIPAHMSFAEASSLPVAYATAQYALRYLARLKHGESILIHAAAGGVGQAALFLAQRTGATIYATVSTPEKKALLTERFGIDARHIFSSRHTLFASQILQGTAGKGVDVVLNSLAGHALTESWRCLAPLGRFIEIGKRDIRAFNNLPMQPFTRNVSFCSLDLKMLAEHNATLLGHIIQEIQALVFDEAAQPRLMPYPLTVYKRSGFEEAFRLLQSGRHVGKVVVDWEQEDTLKVIPTSPLDYKFDSNATYVITGGLGGIGRNLAMWMARNGAKHLCLLSRSGPITETAKALGVSLEEMGVQLYTPVCDVSDTKAVSNAVDHINAHMPPIKGCIHGAMAIENRIFETYDLETFHSVFPAKVQGTYNLHHLLPKGMDFFVILSSIAGFIAPTSQSNYAGASAFQDAFARLRRAQGEHCLSIDLGAVEGFGYIAERLKVGRNIDMMFVDHKVLRERDVHFTLKYACNPRLSSTAPSQTPWNSQIVVGLTTPAFVKKGGVVEDHNWMRMPLFRHLYRMEHDTAASTTAASTTENAGALLRATHSRAEAADIVTKLLAERLARSLAVPIADIDVGRPAYAFGVDSLVAIELLFWFSTEIRADIPVVQILGSSTIAQLGALAASKSEHLLGRDLPA